MAGAICALLFLGFQAPELDTDPARLVTLLGSQKYAERQAAAEALERLGRSAVPALRAARESRDLEVRTRTASLLRKIEGAVLLQPTLLNLDFKNATLDDVINSLSRQSGFEISVLRNGAARLKTQKVTLQAAGPVSFWKGIDLLCEAAQLQPNPGMIGVAAGRAPTFALVAASPLPVFPGWDHGPFRVHLTRLHSERDVSFGAAAVGRPSPEARREAIPGQVGALPDQASRPVPILNVQFNFHLRISAEPRISMMQSGNVQVLEAIDDAGNSLVQPPSTAHPRRLITSHITRHYGGASGQELQLVVPMSRPDSPGSTIKILKGAVPLLVAARRPEPLVVPFTDAMGKSFENHDTAVVIHAIRKNPNQTQTTIDLTIRSVDDSAPIFHGDPGHPEDSFEPRFDLPQHQIDVIDTQGRLLPWFQSSHNPELSKMSMTLNQFAPGIEPKEIRIYSLTKAVTNVPFEFRDILMP